MTIKKPKSKEPTREEFAEFANTVRGRFILGQCCAIGAEALEARGEISNARDARDIGSLFEPFFSYEVGRAGVEEDLKKMGIKPKK